MLDQTKIDGMKTGIFKGSSYYGYRPSVLKSGICKYYRRGIWDKFEWCVMEMALFSKVETGRGLFTNLVNRLKILLMEEIIFLEIKPVEQCIVLLDGIQEREFSEKIIRLKKFCSIVKTCRRGRIVSYINNLARNNIVAEDLDSVVLDKVLKFKVSGDSDELLKYGELFIKYLEKPDRRYEAFNIYSTILKSDLESGSRWRRKDGVNLLLKIVESYNISLAIFKFGLEMFFRKQMTERPAFGIWLISMVYIKGKFSFNEEEVSLDFTSDFNIENYFSNREKIAINESFVVKDYHVNKGYGLEKFAKEGALVIDEDLSVLGIYGTRLRQYYIDVKCGKAEKFTFSKKFKIKRKNIVDEAKLPVIEWEELDNIKVLEDGVCGLKVCCIEAKFKGKTVILKEMRESFRFGRDYIVVDKMKKHFGVKDMQMKRVQINKKLVRIDMKKKTLVGNWKWLDETAVYCMMEKFDNIGDVGKNKEYLARSDVFREVLKIILYDGLFRSSDNILRNILINKDGVVLSIDEGDIYGKRKQIFNKNDWFKKSENIEKTRDISKEIIEEFKLEDNTSKLVKILKEYGFCSEMVDEAIWRLSNYSEIVAKELKIN